MNLDLNLWIKQTKARHPHIRFFCIGYSVWGQPLYALSAGKGGRKLMVNAAHHANEWITSLLLMRFIAENAADLPDHVTFFAVPVVNPDGVDMVTRGWVSPEWKANARGVDLNANYPAGWEAARDIKKARGYHQPGAREYVGRHPLSEPESHALAAFSMEAGFDATVSLHTQGEEIYWQYGQNTPHGAQAIAQAMADASGYALQNAPGESAHAGYKDWFIQAFDKPGFTLECGLGENPLPVEDLDKIYPKVAGALLMLL